MQRNFLYLINPISGTKNKEALQQLIRVRSAQNNFSFKIVHTVKDGNYGFLQEQVKNEHITDIVICGGDGTINQVVSFLLHTDVNIGIIPMGSGNGLALTAGIPRDPSKALDIIFNGKAAAVDGFYINKAFSCMLCGLGFDAEVAHNFAKQSSRGLKTYIAEICKSFFSSKTYPFIVDINGASINTNAFFISIANSNQFGNHVTIAPKASLSDGMLDIVIVNRMNKLKMLFKLIRQIKLGQVQHIVDNEHPKTGIQYFHTKNLRIQNPSLAPLHIDGDPAETAAEFNIQIIEKAFRLIQPNV